GRTLTRLCNMNVNLADEARNANSDPGDRLGRILTRLFFEQFPGQRSIMAEVSRSLLLFGSAAEFPDDFEPEAMSEGWFETITDGLTLDEYVESLLLISVVTQRHRGGFSPDWLDGPTFQRIDEA